MRSSTIFPAGSIVQIKANKKIGRVIGAEQHMRGVQIIDESGHEIEGEFDGYSITELQPYEIPIEERKSYTQDRRRPTEEQRFIGDNFLQRSSIDNQLFQGFTDTDTGLRYRAAVRERDPSRNPPTGLRYRAAVKEPDPPRDPPRNPLKNSQPITSVGEFNIGDRVFEDDSGELGSITGFRESSVGYLINMRGDDGKNYLHDISHYYKVDYIPWFYDFGDTNRVKYRNICRPGQQVTFKNGLTGRIVRIYETTKRNIKIDVIYHSNGTRQIVNFSDIEFGFSGTRSTPSQPPNPPNSSTQSSSLSSTQSSFLGTIPDLNQTPTLPQSNNYLGQFMQRKLPGNK